MEKLLQSNNVVVSLLKNAALIGSFVTMIIGLLCLVFWQFNISLFSNLPYVSGMNPLAAIAFMSAGGSLFFLLQRHSETIQSWVAWVALILSFVTTLIGIVSTIHSLSGLPVELDQLFFTDRLAGNKISPDTSVSFLLIGTALLFLQFHFKKYFTRTAQLLTLLAASLSMFAVIGYMYKALSFYDAFSFAPMSISSALTFTIICLSILFARVNHGITKILTRRTPSSVMAFRLILIALTLPAILGYLSLLGEQLGFFDTQTGTSLLVIGSILWFSIIVWVNTRAIQNLELENLIIKTQLQKKNIELEIDAKQLASKALELEEEKQEAYKRLSHRDKLFNVLESQSTE